MRFVRPVLILAALAVLAPAAASAAPRMYVGFHDDPSFRWTTTRTEALDFAQAANATVVRTTVYWSKVAPRRPAQPTNPFDPAYRFDDLDEMVRGAQQRGMEVLLTIWGTPKWAGPAQNRLPRRLADLGRFSRALASRYSGRHPGYPHVRFYSVWNEPNRGIFLRPQYDKKGRSLAPKLYARLAATAYAGLKAGNRKALVAIGETASNGRDRPLKRRGAQETHSPGRFAQLLAAAKPRVRFDAWAHHPYPTRPSMRPNQKVRWPNVSLKSLPTLERNLDRWFKRKKTPIWITEYGHETRPDKRGITLSKQRAYAAQALTIARKDPRVEMFVWFIIRDHRTSSWQSGLVNAAGAKKPAFARFAAISRLVDARNATIDVRGTNPLVRASALRIGYYSPQGARIGVVWELQRGSTLLGRGATAVPLGPDGWISFRPAFTPERGATYTLKLTATDDPGHRVQRTILLVGPKPLAPRR